MVKLARKFILKEGKNIGDLYHICTMDAFVEHIIPDNKLEASGKYYNQSLSTYKAVSFTRDSLFVVPTETVRRARILFQFKVDGSKLSNKYKIVPYNGNSLLGGLLDSKPHSDTPQHREKEEVVIGPIINFKSYIKEVSFDIKQLYDDEIDHYISCLDQIKSYLGSIPCDRVDLPFLKDGNISIKKVKNRLFTVKTLDDLISLLKNKGNINTFMDNPDSVDLFVNNLRFYDFDTITKILKDHPEWKDKIDISDFLGFSNYRDLDLASFLFKNKYVDVNQYIGDMPILSKACKDIDLDSAFLLLNSGANPNLKDKTDGLTPLMYYILNVPNDSTSIIEVLLDHGANINEKDSKGNTALSYALIHEKNIHIIKFLLDRGADLDIKNNRGRTPRDLLEYVDDFKIKELVKRF